jgi:hypothetical protein
MSATSKEKQTTLPARTPRPWHGMTPGVWFPFLAANRFAVAPSRIPLAVSVSILCWFNLVSGWISEAIYGRRARAAKLSQPPLFVLGHWRSGTTLLHELLVRDTRMIYPTTFDCMSPRHFLLTAKFFERWFDWLLPKKRPMDDMLVGFDRPQEDEFALMNLGAGSPYEEWAFPNRGFRMEYLTPDSVSAEHRARWKQCLDWFLRRQSLKDPAGRLVLKSPPHTARVKLILELYPDARFVHIARDPRVLIPSTIRMWARMTDAVSLQIRREQPLEDHIFNMFELMYDRFEKDKGLIPANQLHQLRYEDLVADPLAELESLYRQLDLGDFETARPAVAKYLEGVKNYKTNKFDLDSVLAAQIREHCGDYMRRYGYSEEQPAPPAPAGIQTDLF